MASPSVKHPVGADAPKNAGVPWSQARSSRFEWVSPTPSPVVVAELERLFPEIIQVPMRPLEEEIGRWKNLAVIARSLGNWVPPEALVREFIRAGASGEIEAVALPHRHYLFRFDNIRATELVLGRPWVVNGQAFAVSEWQPDFIPSESSLLQALLWVRLPLLPIEFWSDEALASILSAAGSFLYSDASTKDRKRGGFARACISVDLSMPLRPGARIQGAGNPFWQQFSFENIEGICGFCGSLHLSGTCGAAPDSSSSSVKPRFGPWMTAVRRRKAPVQQQPASQSASAPGTSSSPISAVTDEWKTPKKLARRHLRNGSQGLSAIAVDPSSLSPGPSPLFGVPECRIPPTVPVIAGEMNVEDDGRADTPASRFQSLQSTVQPETSACRFLQSVPAEQEGRAEKVQSECLVSVPVLSGNPDVLSSNPFKLEGQVKPTEGCLSGLSKRARPVEPLSQRVLSKASKGKGKAILKDKDMENGPFAFSASLDSPRGKPGLVGSRKLKSRRKDIVALQSAEGLAQPSRSTGSDHDEAVALLKAAIQKDRLLDIMDSSRVDESTGHGPEGPMMFNDHLGEKVSGDTVGVPLPIIPK